MKLTVKQQKFVKEYLIDHNGARAATAAGYSKKTARAIAHELLTKPNIQALVADKVEKTLGKLDVSVERVLTERARMALYDMGDLAKAGITGPSDIANLSEDVRQAVTGWKWDKQGNFVVEFADKNSSLTALEKHLGMYSVDDKGEGALSIHIHI